VNPLNEWLHAQLIDALRRCGAAARPSTPTGTCTPCSTGAGIEPSTELKRLQYEILAAGSLSRIPRPAFARDFGAQAG